MDDVPEEKSRLRQRRFFINALILLVSVVVIYLVTTLLPKPLAFINVSLGERLVTSANSLGSSVYPEGTEIDTTPTLISSYTSSYYPSLEEAFANSDFTIEQSPHPSSHVALYPSVALQFEDGDSISTLYFGYPAIGDHYFGKTPYLYCCRYEKNGTRVSEMVARAALAQPEDHIETPPFLITLKGRVADNVIFSILYQDMLASSNDGRELLVGYTTDPAIRNLTILGVAPTGIVEYQYQGQTWYIWYFDDLGAMDHLSDDPDFSFGRFTYGQLINTLQIRT
jgi:hypothetical protein